MGKNLSYLFLKILVMGSLLAACDGASPNLHGNVTPGLVVRNVADTDGDGDATDSPLKLVGERIFRENRFSQYFYANSQGSLSRLPAKGDSVVDTLETITANLVNPYRGQAISCAACHFVDQMRNVPEVGVRAYTDLSRRSRIPDRGEGPQTTVRNSPNMVGMALRDGMFLHHDGEFVKPEDLVRGGYLGRNMGWKIGERQTAIHHIAQVVRLDDGSFPTETDLKGLSYKDLMAGSSRVPNRFQIPDEFKIDISKASDDEIFDAVVKLVGGYLRTLDYSRDQDGYFNGSPYDLFLRKNNLPLGPEDGESALSYSQRLVKLVGQLKNTTFVAQTDGQFKLQKQDFIFAEKELQGFKVFFGKGRCTECHTAPDFTDRLFHNTGASQDDYEKIHGVGSFMNLKVPSLSERNSHAELYLPASEQFPQAQSLLRSIPSKDNADRADLGAWIVFANPNMPTPQTLLRAAICKSVNLNCNELSENEILKNSLAMVKTPTVRDLGQSDPYLHTGQADKIENVLDFYIKYSKMAKQNLVRNADPKLQNIDISEADKESLSLFLKSLNEDYD